MDDAQNTTTFFLAGHIDEHAKGLQQLFENPSPHIVINFKHVEKVNSVGVRLWIEALEQLPSQCRLEFTECSVPVVSQINMVKNFIGNAKVLSFFAPYYCPRCDVEYKYLLNTQEHFPHRELKAPEAVCAQCKESLQFDDIEADYLQVVRYGWP